MDNSDKDSDFMSEDSGKRKKNENGQEHACPICNKVCPTVRGLNIHLARHASNDESRKKVRKDGKGKDSTERGSALEGLGWIGLVFVCESSLFCERRCCINSWQMDKHTSQRRL